MARYGQIARFCVPLAALVALTGTVVSEAFASLRPDLVETAVSVSPRTAEPGTRVRVTDMVLNRGQGPAPTSTTRFYL